MGKCVRCGNEIDVFSKNPNKVFYCRKCSLEILRIDEEKLFINNKNETMFIPENKNLYVLIPGIYQLQRGKFLKACAYFYIAIFFPVSWFVFLSLFLTSNNVSHYDVKPLYFFSFLVVLQFFMIFFVNLKEVSNEVNRS